MKEELSAAENEAYELIVSKDGLYQSELWKALDATSRRGSELAMSLTDKGLIEREVATYEGQRTYFLRPTDGDPSESETTERTSRSSGVEIDDFEERAEILIRNRGGLYQSQLWKELGVRNRNGSRIATSLEEAGAIRRHPATYNGQRTYLLLPPKEALDFSLLMAGDKISPLVGEDQDVDPIENDAFSGCLRVCASTDGVRTGHLSVALL